MDTLPIDTSYEVFFNRYYIPTHNNTKIIYDTVKHRTLHLTDGLTSIRIIFSIRWMRFKTKLRLFTPFWLIYDYKWFKHMKQYDPDLKISNFLHFDFKGLFS